MAGGKTTEPQPLGSTSGKRGYIRSCQRCGKELRGVGRTTKWCPDCRLAVRAQQSSAYYQKQKAIAQANREVITREASLRLLARVADWAGISYGALMAKSPDARAALVRQYQEEKGEIP